VIKQHGLLEGLFSAEELVSDNVKDKELKVIFLQKVIDTISESSFAGLYILLRFKLVLFRTCYWSQFKRETFKNSCWSGSGKD